MVLIKSEIKDEEMIFERYSICCFAGIFITLQGTFNAKLSSHIGIWSTSIITHLIGFLIATTVFLLKKEEKVTDLKSVKSIFSSGCIWWIHYLCRNYGDIFTRSYIDSWHTNGCSIVNGNSY